MTERQMPEPAGPSARPGLKVRLEEKLGLLGDPRIVAYRGHGTRHSLHLRGRLVEAKAERRTGGSRGILRNLMTAVRRLESDEIAGARLCARYGDREHEIHTDAEGYFQLNLYVGDPLESGWHEVDLDLIESVKENARAHTTALALVPSEEAEFAIVSDLDDTVIRSSATDRITMARRILFEDATSRTPFEGVERLYRALMRGPDEDGVNPLFYLSRSGWNLYDLFIEFFDAHDIPPGPMFLRDMAIREDKSQALGSEHHKLSRIRSLLQLYPGLPFVLIGDSGQGDITRYRRIAMENPGRVKAIYVRDVSDDDRDREIESIAEDLRQRDVPTLLGSHSLDFAKDMAERGLISVRALAELRAAADGPSRSS